MTDNDADAAQSPHPGASDRELGADLNRLGEQLLTLAQELASGRTPETSRTQALSAAAMFSDRVIAGIALSIYRARQRRAQYFDPQLFGEPAWDMLLELLVNRINGTRISSTSLCLAAAVPVSTASRVIKRLEREGLLQKFAAPDDKRLILVELTTLGYKLMRSYISDGVLRHEMPIAR